MGGHTDILHQRHFIGRGDALEEFDKFLNDSTKRIFLILGPGGIGKTWLVQRLVKYAQIKYPELLTTDKSIDLLSTRYHRVSELWETIARLSGKYGEFEAYRREYAELQTLRAQNQGFPHAERALWDKDTHVRHLFAQDCQNALGDQVALLWFDTFEAVRNDPVGGWLLEELPHAVSNVRLIIAGRPGERPTPAEESDLVQQYELSGLDSKDIQRFYQTRFYHDPNNLADQERSNAVETERPSDREAWNRLCEKLEYHPLAMDLAILWSDSRIATYEELDHLSSAEIMPAIFSHLRDVAEVPGIVPQDKLAEFTKEDWDSIKVAAYQVILYMAFLNRRFNEYFLERVYPKNLLGQPSLEHAKIALRQMAQVPSIFFVKEREGGVSEGGYLQLHDEVRDRVLEILWPVEDDPVKQNRPKDSLGADREDLAKKALEIYDDLIEKTSDDREQEELRVEQLGYMLKIDLPAGYKQFREDFQRNFANQKWGICQLLLNEISPYHTKKQLNLVQRNEFEKFRFQLALAQRYFEIAEGLAQTPSRQADYWLEFQRYYAHTNLDEAKRCAGEALSICREHELSHQKAQAERALGFVCRELGQLKEAIEWYQKCQKTSRSLGGEKGASLYAYAQNNEGYIWALIGEYDEAIETVENALRIRRKYGSNHETAQSLSTLGEIARFQGDFHKAGNYYRTATDIFRKLHAHDWEAILWQQRAENARRIAEQEAQYDYTDENRVKKYLGYAVEDIELSLALFDKYHLNRGRHNAWRRKGLICRDQGKLAEAESWLGKAFDLAKQSNDFQEILECITFIADIQVRQQNYKEVFRTLAQVGDFKQAYNYQVFLALSDVYQADTLLAQGELESALQHYADGLLKLAQEQGYGHARLGRLLPGLPNALDRLPTSQEQRRWCYMLLDLCKEEGIEQVFPQLPRVVKRYLDGLDFSTEGNSKSEGGGQK